MEVLQDHLLVHRNPLPGNEMLRAFVESVRSFLTRARHRYLAIDYLCKTGCSLDDILFRVWAIGVSCLFTAAFFRSRSTKEDI